MWCNTHTNTKHFSSFFSFVSFSLVHVIIKIHVVEFAFFLSIWGNFPVSNYFNSRMHFVFSWINIICKCVYMYVCMFFYLNECNSATTVVFHNFSTIQTFYIIATFCQNNCCNKNKKKQQNKKQQKTKKGKHSLWK